VLHKYIYIYNPTDINKILLISTQAIESDPGFMGPVIGPVGLCLNVVDGADADTIEALNTIDRKVLARVVVTCQTDSNHARSIIKRVVETHNDITFTPEIFSMNREAFDTKYDLSRFEGNDHLASMLEGVLIPINVMVHNYLAEKVDEFGEGDDTLDCLLEPSADDEGDDTNNSNSGGGGGASGSTVSVATGQKMKCSIQHCKGKPTSDHPLLPCANEACNRMVHKECCFDKVYEKHKLTVEDDSAVFCTKKCHNEYEKSNNSNARKNWEKDGMLNFDGKGGVGPSSIEILLKWWTDNGGEKYNKYRGGTENRGKTKKDMADALAKEMNDKGVTHKRTGKQVMTQIAYLEQSMRTAIDFSETDTGVGLQDTDVGTYKDLLIKRCKYYDTLIDIVKDRAGFDPHCTTDDPDWRTKKSSPTTTETTTNDNDDDTAADNSNEAPTTPKAAAKSPSPSKRRKTNKQANVESIAIMNEYLKAKTEHLEAKKKARDDPIKKAEKALKLARSFKTMARYLDGDRVQAARVCEAFAVFLTPEEKEELARTDL
jgi:hypothetical protein